MMVFTSFDGVLVVLAIGSLGVLFLVWPRVDHQQWAARTALAMILFFGVLHQLMYRTIAEDAFITFRYALNLAQGNGPVFNIGEHVEGYSNFLWMVILGAGHWLSGWPIPTMARVLGVLAVLGTILVSYWLSRDLNGASRHAALSAALFVASSGSFVAHGPGGMETTTFAFLLILTIWAAIREYDVGTGFLAALTTMTRPEGILLVFPLAMWLWVFRTLPTAERVRKSLFLTISLGLLLIPWTAWRVWYYGYLIPNAIQAKQGSGLANQLGLGFVSTTEFILANPFLFILCVLVFLLLLAKKRGVRRAQMVLTPGGWLLLSAFLMIVGFASLVGGDWMPGWRYLAPAVPLACVLLVHLWYRHAKGIQVTLIPHTRPIVPIALSVLMVGASFLHPSLIPRVRLLDYQVDGLAQQGLWFKETLPSGSVIATYANGALSYHAGPAIRVIDRVGLTDEHIARAGHRDPTKYPWNSAYDDDYIVARQPLIVTLTGRGFHEAPSCELLEPFSKSYDAVSFRFRESTNPLGQYFNLLILRSKREEVIRLLLQKPGVELVPCPT